MSQIQWMPQIQKISQIQKFVKLKKGPKYKKCVKFKKCSKFKKCLKLKQMSQCGLSKMTLTKKWPKFKNDQNARSNGTAWAPKARRPAFGSLCIRPTILPFLCSCPFLVSMFAVGLCVLWVLCGASKATARCYTSICDGIIW